jgi:hypothetical protein
VGRRENTRNILKILVANVLENTNLEDREEDGRRGAH